MLKTASDRRFMSVRLYRSNSLLFIKLVAFTVILSLQASAEVVIQTVTLSEKNAPLEKVLKKIESQTDYTFLYEDEVLKKTYPITVQVKDASIEQVLSICFKNQPLTYKVFDYTVVVKEIEKQVEIKQVVLEAPAPIDVSGIIQDNEGNPVAGVSVTIKGTRKGTVTNTEGKYSLNVLEDATLVFTYVGYLTQEIDVKGRNMLNIKLAEDDKSMGEVVVVGYGTQKKSLVTGAISSVKEDQLATTSTTRIEQALQGRAAGVYVLPGSGSPGAATRIRVRGTGSNGSAEPLYIVDGIRSLDITFLDPSEVASIEVLKDAASSAIYGAEGANGVVIITTKTGRKNALPNISYSGQFGIQSVGKMMPMMDAVQYGSYLEEANAPARPTPEEYNSVGKGTDWFNAVFEPAPMYSSSINITGGSEKSTYLVGGTMFKQQGIAGGDKAQFDRYTFRLNSDHQIKSWLHVGNRLSYSNVNRNVLPEDVESGTGSILYNALRMDPITPLTYTGALPPHAQSAIDQGFSLLKDENGDYYGVSKYVNSGIQPLAQIDNTHSKLIENRLVGNVFANIDLAKGLKFNSSYSIDFSYNKVHGWNPTYWAAVQGFNLFSTVFDTNIDRFMSQFENYLTYSRKLGDHNFNLLAGTSAVTRTYNRLNGTSIGMFREEDKFAFHDFNPAEGKLINGLTEKSTLASYYGRVSYDYKNKYIFNATVRRDGSSLLPPDKRWGVFPSASFGWVLSNESFFKSKSIDFIRLRASWGQNGSLSNLIGGGWASAISTQNLNYANSSGALLVAAEPTAIPNYNLKWETSEQLDFGVDVRLFDNRINFTADYFNKITKDLLTPGSPPGFAGFPIPTVNGGNVRNKGFEFELAYNESKSELKYDISVNATAIKNEVTYLNPEYPRISGASIQPGWTATAFEVGNPVWYFRGYKTDGIFQNQAEIDDYLAKNGIAGYAPKPGDTKVVDVNKDGTITPDDHTYIGSPHPDFMYGARVALNFKGFDFLVFAQGQGGNDVLMGYLRTDAQLNNRPAFLYTDRWTGEGSTNDWFRADLTDKFKYHSDFMVFSASFMRIRQLQLGYTLPGSVVEKLRIKNLRVYISLDNFFTFTNYPGIDPEAGSESRGNGLGIDRIVYPVAKKALAGITLNF
ncbi:MAG TPA: TonB-dependent receptor [Flavitalea sp.]|nr:TonB-dependent receptor [Flavitalea sp.]